MVSGAQCAAGGARQRDAAEPVDDRVEDRDPPAGLRADDRPADRRGERDGEVRVDRRAGAVGASTTMLGSVLGPAPSAIERPGTIVAWISRSPAEVAGDVQEALDDDA